MKNRFWKLLPIALVISALFAAAAVAAQDGTKQIGLVIAFPEEASHTEIVTVPAEATTFDALKAASVKLVSQDTQFGPAVCSINEVGCPADNCFCDPKRFWAYFHLDAAAGQWVAAQEGVGAYVPADGAVEGFVWSEADANFAPIAQPPVYTLEQIRSAAASPLSRIAIWAVPLLIVVVAGVIGGMMYRKRSKSRKSR